MPKSVRPESHYQAPNQQAHGDSYAQGPRRSSAQQAAKSSNEFADPEVIEDQSGSAMQVTRQWGVAPSLEYEETYQAVLALLEKRAHVRRLCICNVKNIIATMNSISLFVSEMRPWVYSIYNPKIKIQPNRTRKTLQMT
jgi:hypothetical protein